MQRTYERVTYRPIGAKRARSVLLRDVEVSGELLRGIEVDRHGGNAGDERVCERRHLIGLDLVTRRVPYALDRHYGALRPVD
jgi:hypothetical protein